MIYIPANIHIYDPLGHLTVRPNGYVHIGPIHDLCGQALVDIPIRIPYNSTFRRKKYLFS